MNDLKKETSVIFISKIVQGGAVKSLPLSDIINKKFKDIYLLLLKELKINKKDVLLLLTNNDGKAF